jgi:hypothetical protein
MPRSLADGHRRVSIGTTAPAAFSQTTATPATVDEADAATLASGRILSTAYDLVRQSSDTIDEKALDQIGNSKLLGNENYAGGLTLFRYFNSSGGAEAVYDDVNALLVAAAAARTPVYVFERLTSKLATEAYATGDEIAVIECLVDQPATPTDATGYIKRRFELLPQRWSKVGAALAAGTAASVPLISSVTPASQAVGEPVVIAGARFTGTTDVDFDAVAATFTVVSDSSIVAVVPAAATGEMDITVTNAGGVSAATAYTVGT